MKNGVTRQDLKNIPIMMVGMEALNENMREIRNDHLGSHQITTRGLCLSEHDTVATQDVAGSVAVTAILCLSGLPSDLTASILAHGMFLNFTNLLLVTMISRLSFLDVLLNTLFSQTCSNRGNSRLY
jgi:hypothetical protein